MATLLLIRLSSTRRTLYPSVINGFNSGFSSKVSFGCSPRGRLSTIFCGSVTVNVVPCPYTLSTVIVPDISSTRRFVMDNPNPVPSTLRFRLESTCLKSSKILSRFSSSMPHPVSFTCNTIHSVSGSSRLTEPATDTFT